MRFALVTGAASGIGRATVAQLKADGWWVCAADLNAISVPADLHVRFDVQDPIGWREALTQVSQRSDGRLDLLVNSAGLGGGGPLSGLEVDRARLLLNVNVLGPLLGVQAALPLLQNTPSARVVNVGSMLGFHGVPNAALYSASKAAVHSLSQSLDLELDGVSVIAVAPGLVDTPMAGELLHSGATLLSPERVAEVIVSGDRIGIFPVGPEARWMQRLARWWPSLLRRRLRETGYK